MYSTAFHSRDLDGLRFLVTGGAGFIGSHIAEYLLDQGAGHVRVLDNLSEGKLENIAPWLGLDRFSFVEGDITRPEDCARACEGIDLVSHQAALGSVPRSIRDPVASHAANVTGFLNLLVAARDAGIRRLVYASSSSVYGDSPVLPKTEDSLGRPLSPYAATKLINEVYADVFSRNYPLETVGLRYFNVFGPRQKPDGPYAAVIPLFMDAILRGQAPRIHGDGDQSRDFTFVANAVEANIRGLLATNPAAVGRVYNVAFGERATVNDVWRELKSLTGSTVEPEHVPPRAGDVRDSLADISAARELLGYTPSVSFREGLGITFDWFRQHFGPEIHREAR